MKVTAASLTEMKSKGERIVMVAAYDCPTAKLLDAAGVDSILVGDSLGNVVLGLRDTLGVTVEDIIYHLKAVSRGVERALVVGDMPFMSYQASEEDAIRNAGRLVKEGGAEAVKVEGGGAMVSRARAIVESGIPVIGHLGLTPQWYHQFGGFRVQGKTSSTAKRLMDDAIRLERAGASALVLECVPWQLAKLITEKLEIPTIGIGAGPYCDGQVVVLHDILGMEDKQLKFVKRYANVSETISRAISEFRNEVKSGKFPTIAQSFEMPREEMRKLLAEFRKKGRSGHVRR
ncbi:MAG: 3-methyl-2-oxobutanoate hydroxymethyltransferase [Candidatus Hadarchaeales archaeon]